MDENVPQDNITDAPVAVLAADPAFAAPMTPAAQEEMPSEKPAVPVERPIRASAPAVISASAADSQAMQAQAGKLLTSVLLNRFVMLTAFLYCVFHFFLVPALIITGATLVGLFVYVHRFGGDVGYWVERTQAKIHQWLTPSKARYVGLSPRQLQ